MISVSEHRVRHVLTIVRRESQRSSTKRQHKLLAMIIEGEKHLTDTLFQRLVGVFKCKNLPCMGEGFPSPISENKRGGKSVNKEQITQSKRPGESQELSPSWWP